MGVQFAAQAWQLDHKVVQVHRAKVRHLCDLRRHGKNQAVALPCEVALIGCANFGRKHSYSLNALASLMNVRAPPRSYSPDRTTRSTGSRGTWSAPTPPDLDGCKTSWATISLTSTRGPAHASHRPPPSLVSRSPLPYPTTSLLVRQSGTRTGHPTTAPVRRPRSRLP